MKDFHHEWKSQGCNCKHHRQMDYQFEEQHGEPDTYEFDKAPLELARAYVLYQCAGKIYDPHTSLMRGTVFPELDMPYERAKM